MKVRVVVEIETAEPAATDIREVIYNPTPGNLYDDAGEAIYVCVRDTCPRPMQVLSQAIVTRDMPSEADESESWEKAALLLPTKEETEALRAAIDAELKLYRAAEKVIAAWSKHDSFTKVRLNAT